MVTVSGIFKTMTALSFVSLKEPSNETHISRPWERKHLVGAKKRGSGGPGPQGLCKGLILYWFDSGF